MKNAICIVVRLQGGLGNQLFQYAAGFALAERLGLSLALDVNSFPDINNRLYALGYFNISAQIIKKRTVYIRLNRALAHLNRSLVDNNAGNHYILKKFNEKFFHYDPEFLEIKSAVYLEGYWQTYKYFTDYRDALLEELTFSAKPMGLNADLLATICNSESVAIHIRRGDYALDPTTNSYHGVCSIDYYKAAINRICESTDAPNFYLFSDDPEWVKNNFLNICTGIVVENNGVDGAHEDLHLMAACKHFIIANSSFSWWGAWLSTRKGKIVIAPQKWFEGADHDTSDLIPESWIRL
jgi:hypothetical protein